jgi:hypothetical protein
MLAMKNNKNVAGYEFVCKNEKCNYFNTGFTLYKEWPVSHIDLVINSKSVQQHKDLQDRLIKNKEEGRKYALLTLPNTENVPIIGKRIQLFCKKDCIIWERDLVEKNDVLDMYCDKCKERLVTADEARAWGLFCPSCKMKLSHTIWFSNI